VVTIMRGTSFSREALDLLPVYPGRFASSPLE
jgi:hypothetical protein